MHSKVQKKGATIINGTERNGEDSIKRVYTYHLTLSYKPSSTNYTCLITSLIAPLYNPNPTTLPPYRLLKPLLVNILPHYFVLRNLSNILLISHLENYHCFPFWENKLTSTGELHTIAVKTKIECLFML